LSDKTDLEVFVSVVVLVLLRTLGFLEHVLRVDLVRYVLRSFPVAEAGVLKVLELGRCVALSSLCVFQFFGGKTQTLRGDNRYEGES
jgi:hypothetical protein